MRDLDRDYALDRTTLDGLAGGTAGLTLSAFDSSPDCMKIVDLDGSLVFMNQNGLGAMEIDDRDAVIGQTWSDLWPAESGDRINDALHKAGVGVTTQFEAYCPTAKGTPRWWHVTVAPMRDDSGRIYRVFANSRDVTKQVQQARELEALNRKLRDELEQREAILEQKKLLVAEIDHRVKNSFSLIAGILRLQERAADNDDVSHALSDAANRVLSVSAVHDQLSMSVDATHIALPPFIQSLMSNISASVQAEAVIEATAVADIELRSDRAVALGLVMTELVANACKHAARGSEQPTVIVEIATEKSALVLKVSDNGPGLPKDFDVDNTSGLGLRICRVYAERLGGKIVANSEFGKGTTFRMAFTV